jgi:hypothetical protein
MTPTSVAAVFPLAGPFLIVAGHDANGPHRRGWNQQFAYDAVSVGPDFGFARNGGRSNEDFFTCGRNVVAPGDGTVVYARNDGWLAGILVQVRHGLFEPVQQGVVGHPVVRDARVLPPTVMTEGSWIERLGERGRKQFPSSGDVHRERRRSRLNLRRDRA